MSNIQLAGGISVTLGGQGPPGGRGTDGIAGVADIGWSIFGPVPAGAQLYYPTLAHGFTINPAASYIKAHTPSAANQTITIRDVATGALIATGALTASVIVGVLTFTNTPTVLTAGMDLYVQCPTTADIALGDLTIMLGSA